MGLVSWLVTFGAAQAAENAGAACWARSDLDLVIEALDARFAPPAPGPAPSSADGSAPTPVQAA